MISMKPDFPTFASLCQAHNLVPVCRELLADLETPVSILQRLQCEENVFLFESVEGGERFGRHSFIGLGNGGSLTVRDGQAVFTKGGVAQNLSGGIFALRHLLQGINAARLDGLPPFFGGAAGFIGYETAGEFEKLPPPKAPLDGPTAQLFFADEMLIFDNVRHTVLAVACIRPGEFADPRAAYEHAGARLDAILALLSPAAPAPALAREGTQDAGLRTPAVDAGLGGRAADSPARAPAAHATRLRFTRHTSREDYCEKVDRAKQHIRDGDIIQAVLSQKFSLDADINPVQLYRALRLINPSPYTFFLKMGGDHWIGSSPETMVRLTRGKAELRPIAGTRKRGASPREDADLADELLRDEKEAAEHLMLVDLGRNDLSRVCRPGSVQARDFMHIERYSHVMHLVTQLEGELADGRDALDLLRSVFPAGTLSGAPKIRAMEIINELEDAPRGAYGGAIGYFSYTHNMDLAITIRTLHLRDGKITLQAGAGIVADSDPEKEADECHAKAKALFSAIQFAANNLDLSTL